MSYCFNPGCQKPQNPDNAKFCSNCGWRLLLNERYRALQLISHSTMGRTFLAVDESQASQPRSAIKQFSPKNQGTDNPQQAAELFRRQAAQLEALNQNPQIPKTLAYFELQERQYLVQELIEGQTLAQNLETQGAFNEAQVRQVLTEVLRILQFVHNHGVIHRDINPENIIRRYPPLLSERQQASDGQLVLVDFGAAKITTKTSMAKTGTVIGSAAYTAPEQLIGKAGFSSDFYSLGVTCIHLLTDIHPFDLYNTWEGTWVWQDYLSKPISNQLKQILNKMLAATIRERYQSAEEIFKDLHPGEKLQTLSPDTAAVKPAVSLPLPSVIPTWRCIQTLTGHRSSIYAIAFSPDGEMLASGSADNTIKIWHVDGSGCRCTLSGHSSLINAVAFSLDNRILVSGSWDCSMKIWNYETGELLHTLREHSGWIKCIAISPDNQFIVSGSADKKIKIWRLGTDGKPTLTYTLSGHESAVDCVAISANRQNVVSGSADKTIKIWNLGTGEIIRTLSGHSNSVEAIAISPKGQILASGSADSTIKIWNLGTGELLRTLDGHSDAVKCVAINPQGSILVSGSADKTLKIWHLGTGGLLYTLEEHSEAINAVAISPNAVANTIASGSQEKIIKIWRFQ